MMWHRYVAYEKRGHAKYRYRIPMILPFTDINPWEVSEPSVDMPKCQWSLREAEQATKNAERERSYRDRFKVLAS